MRILNAAEMREMDRRASEDYGVSGIQLMEVAGRAVALAADQILRSGGTPDSDSDGAANLCWLDDLAGSPHDGILREQTRVCIVCGSGNNGGDGFVAARHLSNWGYDCTVLLAADPSRLQGDARTNYEALSKRGLPVIDVPEVSELKAIEDADLVIDALLGTGVRGAVMERLSEIIDVMNRASGPVLAVDIPSGIHADTGQVLANAVVADVTVTFAAPKLGLVLHPGADFAGDIVVADIGIPGQLMELHSASGKHVLEPAYVASLLPDRDSDAHKGQFGHAGAFAGSQGLAGAAEMCARAAAITGAGLTTVVSPGSVYPILAGKLTEVMTRPVGRPDEKHFTPSHVKACLEAAVAWDAVAVGPGIGRDPETAAFVQELVPQIEKPFVIDADGLNGLGENAAGILSGKGAYGVLTPHPGEMARLLGTDADWVQSNRLDAACRAADDFGVVCVLKGAHTIVAEPGGRVYFNLTGNPGLAKGGSGDVLTGMILSLLAQGLEPLEAAVAGVWMHGKAADLAREETGEAAMLATDCLAAIPAVFRLLGLS